MAVRPVARRPARHPAEADLVELVPFAGLVVARIHEMRAVGEAGGAQGLGRTLAEQAAHDVEDARQHVGARRERGRADRLQDGAARNAHVDQVVEAVVEQDLRVENVDEEGAEEHFEHLLVEEKVHRADRLRIGALEIEDHLLALAPHGAGDLVGPHAEAVVVDEILEIAARFRDHHLEDRAHRPLVAVEHLGHRRVELVDAEALGHLVHPPFGEAQGGDDGVEVRAVPVRQAAVAQDEFENFLVQLALAVDLDRRDLDAFLEDLRRVGRQAARHLAADIRHVAEHGGPGDDPAVDIDRHHGQPVVQMADRAVAGVGIVGEEDVAFLDLAVIALLEAPEEGAELADDHFALGVGDHRESVVLLPDAGRHRGAEQHGVHLRARVAHRVLDDVEGDGIDLDLLERRGVGLDQAGWHVRSPPYRPFIGRMRMLPTSSTAPVWPFRIRVVESISVTMAGPAIRSPALSKARS